MKKTIKQITAALVFIFLTVMAVSALNEDDISAISNNISLLNDIQSKLSSSSSARSISRVINSAIKQLNDAISLLPVRNLFFCKQQNFQPFAPQTIVYIQELSLFYN